jgi:hypothetical protein
MSKRIIRIKSVKVSGDLLKLVGRDVHIVRKNDHTAFGILAEILPQSLIIKDKRDHSHQFDFTEIAELIYDEVSPW